MRRLAIAGLALPLFVAFASRTARADGQPPKLTYVAPRECPSEAAFRADVATHVHDRTHASGGRVDLVIEARDPGYEGTLIASDDAGNVGRRHIAGASCSGVARALAFLAALAIELGGRIESEPEPPPPRPAPPPAPPAHAPPAPPAPRGPLETSVVLLGDARGGFAPAVRASAEVGFDIAIARGLLAPSARIVGWAAESGLEDASGSAELRFAGGRLEVCPLRLGDGAVALRPCAGAELATVHAQGQIGVDPRAATELWSSVEATLRVQWNVTSWYFAEAGAGVVAPLVRARYFFEPSETLYVVPRLTLRAALGVGLRF